MFTVVESISVALRFLGRPGSVRKIETFELTKQMSEGLLKKYTP